MVRTMVGGDVLGTVDAIIREHGLFPSEDVRSLLAVATEQRMKERGESFAQAIPRAMAALVCSARVR